VKLAVYDVAASSSGALSVLEEFHSRALEDGDNEYLFIISSPSLKALENVSIARFPWVKKSWLHRLWFDFMVGPRLIREWEPDRILSLQNTIMPRSNVPQTVYEHNCLPRPFCDYRFSLFRETSLWIRQNILGRVIVRSLKKAQHVIVQTTWMKRRCIERLGIPPGFITVDPPTVREVPQGSFASIRPFCFIYPATAMRFKNHELILDACEILNGLSRDYRVLFTLCGSENRRIARMRRRVKAGGLPVEFIGWQEREQLYSIYEKSALLFTSELESYPLPLIEARQVGSPIIAPDTEYAREILHEGDAMFFVQNDAESLARAMLHVLGSSGQQEIC
jgi:glycosyltransferase involved in cell wall biosynthesis